MITLWDFFASLASSAQPRLQLSTATGTITSTITVKRCKALGERIGAFFAALHSHETRERVLSHLSHLAREDKNDANTDKSSSSPSPSDLIQQSITKEIVLDCAVEPIFSRLVEHGGLEGDRESTAKKLAARVRRDFEREPFAGDGNNDERCFSLGDFHPGSVVLRNSSPLQASKDESNDNNDNDNKILLGIIDWEFATVGKTGRGVNGDMSQFLAPLRLLMMNSKPRETANDNNNSGDDKNGNGLLVYEAVKAFVNGVATSYAVSSGLRQRMSAALSSWSAQKGKKDEIKEEKEGDPILEIFRSALILFGREMINQAVDREWTDTSNTTSGTSSSSVKERMVKAGAWYLERAGESVEEMMGEEGNLRVLLMGEQEGEDGEEGGVMLRLFGLDGTVST